jgi:PIN domain nuclease of toxin-antitoxin system
VLDTAALIWWTTNPARLSPKARRAIEAATDILVSTISIWEAALKVKQGVLVLPGSVREFARGLVDVERVTLRPVDADTWIANVDLDWDHKDPADRTIVALAQVSGASLVTSDRRILEFYSRAVW